MRIDSATIGGFGHAMGLDAGHYWVDAQGDDFVWPFAAGWNQPATWAATALGKVPSLTTLSPSVVTANHGDFPVVLEGTNFTSDATMLVNGSPRATAVIGSTSAIGMVEAGDVAVTGLAEIVVINPAISAIPSNTVSFRVIPEGSILFSDGFETGNTGQWSATVQ
jgi:hypothetical protein